MDIGRAFSFVFEDPKWVTKMLFGALFSALSLILVGFPFLYGYQLELIRNVHRGDATPLPEWDHLGETFSLGLRYFLASIVYALPIILLYCCLIALSVLPAAVGGTDSRGNLTGPAAALTALVFIPYCLMFIYALILAVLSPGIALQFARTGEVGATLRFRDVIANIRRAPGPYIIVVLMTTIVLGLVAQLGFVLLCIGIFVTIPYALFVGGHLLGQLWQQQDQAPAFA